MGARLSMLACAPCALATAEAAPHTRAPGRTYMAAAYPYLPQAVRPLRLPSQPLPAGALHALHPPSHIRALQREHEVGGPAAVSGAKHPPSVRTFVENEVLPQVPPPVCSAPQPVPCHISPSPLD